jgi:hypothetical protein
MLNEAAQVSSSPFNVTLVAAYQTIQDDPEHLLGCPGQYISKAGFRDSRLAPNSDVSDGTVEVFKSLDDVSNRIARLKKIQSQSRQLGEYEFTRNSVLIRVANRLSATDAAIYSSLLQNIDLPLTPSPNLAQPSPTAVPAALCPS